MYVDENKKALLSIKYQMDMLVQAKCEVDRHIEAKKTTGDFSGPMLHRFGVSKITEAALDALVVGHLDEYWQIVRNKITAEINELKAGIGAIGGDMK